MALPRGIKHFTDFFKNHENDYVIIGGGAASVTLEDEDLEFRVTKDIDMVLFTNNSTELNKKISEYIFLGKYEVNEKTQSTPQYYRFSEPQNTEFPEIVEIFAKADSEIELKQGQYIIPIQNDSVAQLSAILLDDEYFNLIKANAVKSNAGYSIINSYANICLKARAFRELTDRKEEKKKINKHRNDVVRLAQTLTAQQVTLSGQPNKDFLQICAAIEIMEDLTIKQLIGTALNKSEILDILKKAFPVL
ncbi:MAG: hypothetical protein HYV97_05120 [Bdellovibrio sp.]|nr:hypothetical protein [Bdellovibrio sp.]